MTKWLRQTLSDGFPGTVQHESWSHVLFLNTIQLMASQITDNSIVLSAAFSGLHNKKHTKASQN